MPVNLFGTNKKKNFAFVISTPVEEAHLKLTPNWKVLPFFLIQFILINTKYNILLLFDYNLNPHPPKKKNLLPSVPFKNYTEPLLKPFCFDV